jgi:hypothetical protein
VSEAVLPIGLVAADTAAATMTLEDWGMQGKSRLDGKPVSFYLWLIRQIGRELMK